MEEFSLATFATVIVCSTSVVLVVLAINFLLSKGSRASQTALDASSAHPTRVYQFRNDELISEHDAEDVFLGGDMDRSAAWTALIDALSTMQPRIAQHMDTLRRSGTSFFLHGTTGAEILTIAGSSEGDTLTISIGNATAPNGQIAMSDESQVRQNQELDRLKWTMDQLPTVAWREGEEGQITWANAAYLDLVESQKPTGTEVSWPLPRLFSEHALATLETGQVKRVSVESTGAAATWFEVATARSGDDFLYVATPADKLVQAEEALRDFIQTLSKTFADLPIGLAIFDRRRELVLFNPALVTLSTLSGEFLSSRPTLYNFLDQLRENRHMPEPKDYKAWRESISKLEADAADGTYHDMWSLPMGQTYRVIGRPHPDGAIAFMFEDITSEISLTRQFRADLDLYQAVLDHRQEAIAVFSAEAQLVLSNASYAEMWGHDPREMLGAMNLREAIELWEVAMSAGPIWREMQEFALERPARSGWTGTHSVPGRGTLKVRIEPLKAGSTMLTFNLLGEEDAPVMRKDEELGLPS